MRVEPHRLSQQRVEDAVEPVFPAGGSQLEVEVFASLLSEGVSNKLGGCSVVAGLAFQMDDTRAVQEDVVVAMQHEAAYHQGIPERLSNPFVSNCRLFISPVFVNSRSNQFKSILHKYFR